MKPLLFLLAVAAFLCSFALDKWPLLSNDEVIDISVAWSYLNTGKFGSPMFPGVLSLDDSFLLHAPLSILVLIPSIKLLGLGIIQTRLVSVLFGLAALLLTYLLASKLYGKSAGLLAVAILGVNPLFALTARQVRPEVYVSAIVLASIYVLVLAWHQGRKWQFGLSGMIAGLALLAHAYAFLVVGAACGIFLFKSNWRFLVAPSFWCYILGLTVPVFLFYWLWLKPNQAALILQVGNYFSVFSQEYWRHNILGEIERYTYWQQTLVSLPPALAGSFVALRQPRRNYIMLITIASFLGGFWLFMINKSYVYLGIVIPYISILLAVFLNDSWRIFIQRGSRTLSTSLGRTLLCLICIGWIVVQGGVLSWRLLDWNRADNDYFAFMSKVNRFMPASEEVVIIGNPGYWLGIEDRLKGQYVASHLPREEFGEMPLAQFVKSRDDAVILVDDYWMDRGLNSVIGLQIDEGTMLSGTSLNLVGQVSDRFYGSAGYHGGSWQTLSILETVHSKANVRNMQ